MCDGGRQDMKDLRILAGAIVILLASGMFTRPSAAQGVTTGSLAGVVADPQGAVTPGATVLAVHVPSGTTYEGVTQADGRFFIQGLRVGGPYKVTASLTGFTGETLGDVTVSLG